MALHEAGEARRSQTLTAVPFTLAAACARPDWRSTFRWPISYADQRSLPGAVTGAMLDCALGFSDERARCTAMLAIVRAGFAIRVAGFVAWHERAALETGIEWIGLPGAKAEDELPAGAAPTFGFDDSLTWPLLRRIARTASLNRGTISLLRAFVAPDAVAISHNPLLRSTAKNSHDAIGFVNADAIAKFASQKGRADKQRVAAVTDAFAAFCHRYPAPAQTFERYYQRVRRRIEIAVEQADQLLDGLRQMRLPSAIWSGSAGYFPVRAVMIEARRRGSSTTIFDHGGSATFIDEPDILLMGDRHAAERLFLPTEKAVAMVADTLSPNAFRGLPLSRLEGGAGDPLFREAAELTPRKRGSRPRVLYVPTIFNGGRQNLPPLLPDPIHLYHQLAVVEAFRDIPADLVLKPHPGSALNGMPHPLAGLVEIDRRPFIEALADAEVVICDYPQSTAFWEACCSNRRVVMLDLGIVRFHSAGRAVVEDRCAIVPVHWNADNLPVFEPKALIDAALTDRPVDPSQMRQLLAGHTD